MKSMRSVLWALFGVWIAALAIGEELRLNSRIAVDVMGEDATFQLVPGLEAQGKVLCLWKGDALQASFLTSSEVFEGTEEAYLKRTTSGMKAQGAKRIKRELGERFTSAGGVEWLPAVVTAKHGGLDAVQFMYVSKLGENVELVIVTLTDASFRSDIEGRADRLLESVTRVGNG
ncbi:MAG: hypothetical protein AAGB46_10975 [Verrucomicrobiota bacterium]